MSETTAANPPQKSETKKTKKATKGSTPKKSKTPSNHPKYLDMAISAIGALKERNGSSRQAVHKYYNFLYLYFYYKNFFLFIPKTFFFFLLQKLFVFVFITKTFFLSQKLFVFVFITKTFLFLFSYFYSLKKLFYYLF